jgi:hypothetical protein
MSYNFEKVSNAKPNANSEIALKVSDVTSATDTASVLSYNGVSWGNTVFTNTNNKELYYSMVIQSASWGSSTTYSSGDYFVYRRDSTSESFREYLDPSVTTNTGTKPPSPVSNTKWRMSVNLTEAGTYLFVMSLVFGDNFTGSERVQVQFSTESGTVFSANQVVRADSLFSPSNLFGVLTISGNETIRAIVTINSGTIDIMDGGRAEAFSYQIYKMNT